MARSGMFHTRWFLAVATLTVVTASGCSAAQDLVDEQTGGTLPGVSIPNVSIPDIDLNDPDFTMPDIVAPDINIDIENLIVEAPDLPEIRFPDATTIEVPEITSPDVAVAETPEETIYTIEGKILFDFDRADLRPEALDALAEIVESINNRDYHGTIEVAGHTDSVGTGEYNQDLSVRRATGVALWFRERVPAEQNVQAIGYGESQPIAPNTLPDGSDDPVGQSQNRRVEIIVNK